MLDGAAVPAATAPQGKGKRRQLQRIRHCQQPSVFSSCAGTRQPLQRAVCVKSKLLTLRSLRSMPFHRGNKRKPRVFAVPLVLRRYTPEAPTRYHPRSKRPSCDRRVEDDSLVMWFWFCLRGIRNGDVCCCRRRSQVGIPVTLCDERLTSVEARGILKDGGLGKFWRLLGLYFATPTIAFAQTSLSRKTLPDPRHLGCEGAAAGVFQTRCNCMKEVVLRNF